MDINYVSSFVLFCIKGKKEGATFGLILSRQIVLLSYGDICINEVDATWTFPFLLV